MIKHLSLFCFLLCQILALHAQDTFSIVAVDSSTSEVGSAGASCVDLTLFPQFSTDFLGELLPGLGAINTQAFYLENNQINARNQLILGNTPNNAVQWLQNNDVQSNPEIRQYGIAALINGSPQAAAFTGSQTNAYTGQRVGSDYSIQGNILLGPEILDSMEARFLRAKGDLACRLMYAMQGANVVGADSRCASNGSSSLFAFLKVAQASDTFGSPSFLVSVQTANGAGIEPIDSLQSLFDTAIPLSCDSFPSSIAVKENTNTVSLIPNPAKDRIYLNGEWSGYEVYEIRNSLGKMIQSGVLDESKSISITDFPEGTYILKIYTKEESFSKRFIKK